MNELEERVAKALIDADPTVSGYHETHIAAKLPDARAAIQACGIDDLLARIETLELELVHVRAWFTNSNRDRESERYLLKTLDDALGLPNPWRSAASLLLKVKSK